MNDPARIATLVVLLLFTLTSAARAEPVVAIDLMRTGPGEQADYLHFVQLNWAAARAEALRRGYIAAYEVLVREPDGEGWDVMLRTTYPDAEQHAAREENFATLFAEPAFAVKRIDGKGPRDMAEFVDGGGAARIVVRSD